MNKGYIMWLLLLASLTLSCSRDCEYLPKEFTNGMLISPIGTVVKFSNLRILAAKNAAGVATFPVKAKFVDGDNAGELIYDVCSSNGLLRMSSCVTYDLVGIIETPTSITGDVSLVERLGFDSLSTVVSMTMKAPDCSMKICELDVCDKVKFGDSIEVLWPRSIDSYEMTETRTGYFDDNLRTDVFSLASYSESKSNFLSLYAVYDKEGVPFGWGVVEGTANSNHNAQQNVTLRRYGETDKYDVQVHESGNKRLLKLSIGGKSRSFLLQRE